MKTICKQCNENVERVTEGICEVCRPEETQKKSEYMKLSDYRNIYTFTGRSDGLNLIVYGIVLPLLAFGLGIVSGIEVLLVAGILLSLVMFFAAVVRRGRDAGKTPSHTVITLLITTLFISTMMEKSMLGFAIIVGSGNIILGTIAVAVIQNIYLVYLIFAKRSEVQTTQMSKPVKIILIITVGLFLLGLLSAVIIPLFQ